MKTIKLNETIELSFEKAKEMLKNTLHERDFKLLNESTITNFDDNIGFEVCQNRSYSITKINRAGSILYKGCCFEEKAPTGIFKISMMYDYKHPSNFCQNKYNLIQDFKIAL